MTCPHCGIATATEFVENLLRSDPHRNWSAYHAECQNCEGAIILLVGHSRLPLHAEVEPVVRLVNPKGITRPVPPEVEQRLADDFKEAVAVLPDSPKASAALSRRILQDILREKGGAKPSNLESEIEEVVNSGKLPTWLADDLHAVRQVGNFSAHPTKSKQTGDIVHVEPGEADWLLDVIEGMFDFYFVAPTAGAKRRATLNQKLRDAGKPALSEAAAGVAGDSTKPEESSP